MLRRSKEIMHLKKCEVQLPQKVNVHDEILHVVLVKEQKRKNSLKPAPVVGFKILNYYIKELLPAITDDAYSEIVFPQWSWKKNKLAEFMTYKQLNEILKSVGVSDKRFSSRVNRKSIVTNNRLTNCSIEHSLLPMSKYHVNASTLHLVVTLCV